MKPGKIGFPLNFLLEIAQIFRGSGKFDNLALVKGLLKICGDLGKKVLGKKKKNRKDKTTNNFKKNGAGDGTRTHDVQLGKLAFYR